MKQLLIRGTIAICTYSLVNDFNNHFSALHGTDYYHDLLIMIYFQSSEEIESLRFDESLSEIQKATLILRFVNDLFDE